MTLPEVLRSIPDDLLYADRRRARRTKRWCLARGHRPNYLQLPGTRTTKGRTAMTLQSDLEEAGRMYAQRLPEQAETERLAALRIEARHQNNAAAFAAAITEHDTDETENQE